MSVIPLCFSHRGLSCEKHPQWKAVMCWQIAGIFHRPMCSECVRKAASYASERPAGEGE